MKSRAILAAVSICFATIPLMSSRAVAQQASALQEPVESHPSSIEEQPITDQDREHWSFQPIRAAVPPKVLDHVWPVNGLDHFILSELEANHLNPLPRASESTLLRRIHFDLVGLPPSLDAILKFQDDTDPQAYECAVESLLASPAYGERWGQHWLDLARFAETDGFEHDLVRKDAWKYRQWVIDAFNADMPYDTFVRLQLSADLDGDESNDIATMFCMAGSDMPDLNDQDLRRHDKLNEMTSAVGAVLLGLQTHCAQCHDHKYDPISSADFYRLRGVFESAVPKLKRDVPQLQLQNRNDPIEPALYHRGELANKGPILQPKPPRIACSDDVYASFDSIHPRIAFCNWLFHRDNPLVARVIANRIWQHHFGKSLCDNPSDFGVVPGGPSNPELLDWLATELVRSDWSMKHLHRIILTSATYRQSSYPESSDVFSEANFLQAISADPDNRLYSRFPRMRLEGEVIRDALLFVGGRSNLEFGGPSVLPPLPEELVNTLLKGQWESSSREADHCRRSIYVFARRNLRYPIFEVFDRPDAGETCPIRQNSTTAIQMLQMLNSDLSNVAAHGLRDRLLESLDETGNQPNSEQLIQRLFLIAYSRPPTPTERDRLQKFLDDDRAVLRERLLVICIAVLNANEFVYID